METLSEDVLFQKLIDTIKSYHPAEDFSIVYKAYEIARDAHKNQFRKSGEPYIIHPLNVALILTSLEADLESIAAALLHDVVEDTNYTCENIKSLFGEEIANLVDGVTKLDKIKYISQEESQAENYRKMFLAIAKDIRVVLIKIADRLHNMETLQCLRPEKQKRIAQETLDIYAPIAHRLGISNIRYRLEDLCFLYLYPEEYKYLSKKIKLCRKERLEYVNKIVDEIKICLKKYDINAEVDGRPKHFFSIYKKMIYKNKTFDQIYDLFAVRVIVDTIQNCYAVLGIIHEMYKPIPGRFKDYIAMPKSNMYQSLHSTLIGPEGEAFEIQIRTKQMHRIAEYGIAAHWKYKAGIFDRNNKNRNLEQEKLAWLKQILEWQKEYNSNKDYLDALKLDLSVYQSHVYCFTPQGKVISLLSGSTPIDFAYAIHSDVGNKTVGAKVNGKLLPLDYILKNGDRVEIITNQNSIGPKLNWLKIVKTNRAKNKINQWFKAANKIENVERGKELLEKEAEKKKIALKDLLDSKTQKKILEKYNFSEMDNFYAAIGYGAIKEEYVINKLYNDYKIKNKMVDFNKNEIILDENKKSRTIIVKGVGDTNVRFSKCCNPVPIDKIVAFVTRGRGVSLHRENCKNIINLSEENKKRLIEAQWQDNISAISYYVKIKLVCDDIMGILTRITETFLAEKIKIQVINSYNKHGKIIFNLGFNIENTLRLKSLCVKLEAINGIQTVIRENTNKK